MIRNLVHRLWPMPGDYSRSHGYRSRHVGRRRPALVAPTEHAGATTEWSPTAEILSVEPAREPEETATEAAEREAEELARHRSEQERNAEADVAAEWSAILDPVLDPLFAAVNDACRVVLDELGLTPTEADRLLAAYRQAAQPTGEWPTVRSAVLA